jgi:hypothetical protein
MIALVNITSHIRTYRPGEKLGSEFSEKDIKRLTKLKAIDGAADIEDDELDGEFFGSREPDAFLTDKELNKKKKDELIIYATQIGLNGLTMDSSKEQLVNGILNYIEEVEAGEQV